MKNKRLFVDMDGTLCRWQEVETSELYKEGFFASQEPVESVLDAVKRLSREGTDVYVLSCFLADSEYALAEKCEWIRERLPMVQAIFIPCGCSKAEAIESVTGKSVSGEDYLLDDYNLNLRDFKRAGGTGLKILNGFNDRSRSWDGARITNGAGCYEELRHAMQLS